jgi:hypothetical protein
VSDSILLAVANKSSRPSYPSVEERKGKGKGEGKVREGGRREILAEREEESGEVEEWSGGVWRCGGVEECGGVENNTSDPTRTFKPTHFDQMNCCDCFVNSIMQLVQLSTVMVGTYLVNCKK